MAVNRYNDKRGNRPSYGGAAVEKRGSKPAITLGKPFGNSFGRTRPIESLSQAKKKTKTGKTAKSRSQCRRHRNNRVKQNRDAQAAPGSDAINDPAGGSLPEGVRNAEGDQEIGIVCVGPVVLRNKKRRKRG